ncbi:MAG TPA: AAA family ATPase, partial [Gemmatimonadaceae bacterium]|nr:AAA family ATPase [Gemmatimonadaceae bacterium]
MAYMSPEQARDDGVDGRTDIWSLGIVLFEMLVGSRPFIGDTDVAVLRQILDAEPRWQALADAGVPPALERVLRTTLAKRATDRHATPTDFASHLMAAVPGAAPVAMPRAVRRDADITLPDGERHQATVVVCQLGDYSALVERWGADEVDRAAREVRAEAEVLARRHGGRVAHAVVDTTMLVFGLPVASEDDCLRATRAVLELCDATRRMGAESEERGGPVFRLRVGIDAGPVMEHRGTAPNAPLEISGPAARVASQLSAMAPPGEVWVSAECRRLVEGFVFTEPRPPMSLGDRQHPLVPFRVTGESGLQTRIEATERIRGLTPFTGRSHELAMLRRLLAQAREGRGQLVSVVGEAGMGKSRLLHELRQRLHAEDELVLQGRCPAHGGGTAYLPFVHVLRDALHVADADVRDDLEREVVARIRALGAELEEFIPFYLHLLSIPAEQMLLPQHLRGERFQMSVQEAIAALITVCARQRPTVLLLEDWHWADNASRAVLGQIVDLVPEHALLVVVTTRPGREDEWSGSVGHHAAITLRPLEPTASLALLRALLRVTEVPEGLNDLLHERTGGNPFFLEELCQTLLEEGILRVEGDAVVLAGALGELNVPDTVQAVIRARLDRLHRDAREVLRLASVVGREFTRRILELTMPNEGRLPNALEALKVAGLIQQTHVVPEAAYRFKHVLTQEVAYDGLLEHRRRELHGRVGAAIESLYQDRLDEHF